MPDGACHNSAGFYYLPKSQILVEVKKGAKLKDGTTSEVAGSSTQVWHEVAVSRTRIADPSFGYCLDYLGRINYDDVVSVKKYQNQPILGVIIGDSLDKSRQIFETLVQTVFTAISGNPDPGFSTSTVTRSYMTDVKQVVTVFKGEFDPFDPERSAIINESLRKFGFCLILENHTFDINHADIDNYCDAPHVVHAQTHKRAFEYAYKAPERGGPLVHVSGHPAPRMERGIFYRPRAPYQYYVFVKSNMQARGGWRLRASKVIEMENISPVLSVGLLRAAFTQRKTALIFDEGMLRDVCIFKKSELQQAVQIPLFVVQSVVALPANVFQVRIDQTNGMADLINAQDELVKTQSVYLAKLNNLTGGPASADAVPATKKYARQVKEQAGDFASEAAGYAERTSPEDAAQNNPLANDWRNICLGAVVPGTAQNQTTAAPTPTSLLSGQ